MNEDEVIITKTSYSLTAILGWIGVLVGLVAGALQLWSPTPMGITFLVIGLIAGGVTVSLTGPLRRTSQHKVRLSPAQPKQEN